jgi:hypothetical protein
MIYYSVVFMFNVLLDLLFELLFNLPIASKNY